MCKKIIGYQMEDKIYNPTKKYTFDYINGLYNSFIFG